MPRTLPDIENVAWATALRRMDWRQGEHITLIGPTGVGKTELMVELLEYHRFALFLNTKRIDPTQKKLKGMGYRTIQKGRDLNPEVAHRFILAPPWPRRLSSEQLDSLHRREFIDGLTRAFWQTGWTIAIDELEYINRDLKIESPVNKLLRQGRSQGNSMILGTQRPRYVTLHAYEQATHLFLWKMKDTSNIARAAELAGVNRVQVLDIIIGLGRHDVLYVNTVTDEMFVTNTRWE